MPPSASMPPHLRYPMAAPVRHAAEPTATQTSQAPLASASAGSNSAERSNAPAVPQAAPANGPGSNAKPSAGVSGSEDTAPQTASPPSFNAAYLHNPPPAYPAMAQQRSWEGTVLLKVHVLASGKPDQIEVASSSGHAPLDDAAKEAVSGWRFMPAKRAAQAVDGWVQVPVEFKLGT
ncbi:energy transducer TonB [Trinickia terrae]|uniref:Energy transducer TonB n=2 Tax=Trinickia terrae TaxID=2571161 RepID=A0A4U1I2E0_9BURK|nr:energy transducer TonB [Trinickia terrae]